MSFRCYLQYSASEIQWIDGLPVHWLRKRLKHFLNVLPSNVDKHSKEGEKEVFLCNYTDVYYNDWITGNLKFMKATANLSQLVQFSLRTGDVVITKDSEDPSDIAVPALVPQSLPGVVCGYHLSILRIRDSACSRFLFYLLCSDFLHAYFFVNAKGLTRVGLSQFAIANTRIPLPPLDEQAQIGHFLDHETAKIDALVAEQKRLIELLKEKRQAIISHATRTEVNATATKIGRFVDVLPGYAFSSTAFAEKGRERLLRGINVGVGETVWSDTVYLDVDSDVKADEFALKTGDIVLGMDRPWISGGLRLAKIEPRDIPSLLVQRVARIRASGKIIPDYLEFILRSEAFRKELEVDLTGVSVPHISESQIAGFRVAIPDLEMQKARVEWAQMLLVRLGSAQEAAAKTIQLLLERRSALISAAVTGKIDVRDWQQPKAAKMISQEATETL